MRTIFQTPSFGPEKPPTNFAHTTLWRQLFLSYVCPYLFILAISISIYVPWIVMIWGFTNISAYSNITYVLFSLIIVITIYFWVIMLFALPVKLYCPGHKWTHGSLLFSECMAEVASMTVGAGNTSKDHPADFSLVAWVAEDWAELLYPMGELAMVSVRACTGLLPFVA